MAKPEKILAAFQGGGAKGIAYVGAVRALEEHEYAFEAVAGTSAGSIVAALVAAGFDASELAELVPELLARIDTVKPPAFATPSDPRQLGHYSLERVRGFLETSLRTKVRPSSSTLRSDVTFRELFDATKIELNILVTAAPGDPTVLNVWSSPECQVSYAVVASSAIPFVMNPQLLTSEPDGVLPEEAVKPGAEDPLLDLLLPFVPLARAARHSERIQAVRKTRAEVSQVAVDGGAWANYPGLCFTDPSLRYYHRAPDLSRFPMVGFVLDPTPDPADPEVAASKARLAHIRRSLMRALREFVLNFRLFSFVLPGLAMAFGSLYLIYLTWNGLPSSPDAIDLGWRLIATPTLAWMAALGCGWTYLNNYVPAAQVSLATLIGGLTSVSVKVPPWVGAHPNSRIIRVPASSRLITTVNFTPSPEVISSLVERAAAAVAAELARLPLDAAHPGRRQERAAAVRFVDMSTFDSDDLILGWGLHKQTNSAIGSALDKLGMR